MTSSSDSMNLRSLTRRSILVGSIATASAGGIATAVKSAPMTPQERMMFHLAEFKRAAEEIFDIDYWGDIALDGFYEDRKWRGAPMIVGFARRPPKVAAA